MLLWAHVAGIGAFGMIRGHGVLHSIAEAAVVGGFALVGSLDRGGRRFLTSVAALGLLTSSAILVHLSGGSIEMHFHFFVMLGVIMVYDDWFPFLLAFGYVVVHHGLMGALDPHSVYNHPAAWNNPWLWAGIHGTFIVGACVANVVHWRMSETARARAEQYATRLAEGRLRRRQALEINDNVVQGLAVAKWALELGDEARMREALARTLASARHLVSGLLSESGGEVPTGSGDLVREHPATVVAPE